MVEENENSILSLWKITFIDSESGGYVKVHKRRITQSQKSKNEQLKYTKEHDMAVVFARNGYNIEMLEEISRISSPDVTINGIPADFKYTKSAGNIVKYAQKAIREQKAQLVLYEVKERTDHIKKEFEVLTKMNIHGKYFVEGKLQIYEF